MYLTCPNCQTVYTVRAAMLREGQGEVRCGACRTLFNALDYLSDELPEASEPSVDDASSEPAAAIEEPDVPLMAEMSETAPPQQHEAEETLLDPDPHSVEYRDASPLTDGLPALRAAAEDRVPEALARDFEMVTRERKGGARNFGLTVLALLLLCALGVQYMWFAPRDLVSRFPLAAPAVDRFCALAGCPVPERRDTSQIQVLSREVRAHPRYEGALLVSAIISNVAPWPQPFPRLRFRLYNVNGQTIASRVFAPQQYLAEAPGTDAMLEPGKPLQIALEMLAPEEASVSFEISFL